MGYILSTQARNKNLAASIAEFLSEKAVSWARIAHRNDLPWNPDRREFQSDIDEKMFFEAVGRRVETYYGSGLLGWDRVYTYTLIRWVALRVGSTRKDFGSDQEEGKTIYLPIGVPFYHYDGEDRNIAIFQADAPTPPPDKVKGLWVNVVDTDGVFVNPKENSLQFAATESFMGGPKEKAFNKAFKALGEQTSKNRTEWQRKWKALRWKFAKPEIDLHLPVLWKEMAELTKQWDERKAKG